MQTSPLSCDPGTEEQGRVRADVWARHGEARAVRGTCGYSITLLHKLVNYLIIFGQEYVFGYMGMDHFNLLLAHVL